MRAQTRLLVNFVVVALVSGAPKSRNDKFTTYDQKQTGDYNIQLHLKDFQIVALLSEDALGAFGVSTSNQMQSPNSNSLIEGLRIQL